MNLHGIPYLRFIIPIILGLLLGACLDKPVPYLDVGLLLAALLGSLLAVQKIPYRFRWVFGSYVHVLLFAFGYHQIVQFNEMRKPGHFSEALSGTHYFIGTVYETPSKGAKMKVPIRMEALGQSADSLQKVSGNVMLFLEANTFSDSLQYGDRLGFQAVIRPTEPAKNPYAFDYSRYLHFQNIHHQAFVKPDSIRKISTGHGWLLWQKAYASRAHLLSLLQRYFPATDEYAVASALLLGYTEDLSDELRMAYAETGSMHALAVSGTHIGMLYVGLMFLVGGLNLRGRSGRLIETALVLLAIWAFTFLTGATASVLRASVMFSIYMLGKAFWREASAWNVLPASAFILLVFNPYLLFNIGFQLSYAAVAGMVFFYPRFYKLFPPLPRYLDEPLQVFLVGVAAQLGTLPLTLYYFNQFPVYFWLAGWVVVFAGAVFLWGGAMLVLLDSVSQLLANWLGNALYFMLLWVNKIIFFIQSLPGGVVRNVWVAGWVVPVLYGCLALIGAAMVTRRGKWIRAFIAVMAVLGGYRTIMVTGKQAQKTILIYTINKARLIDFMEGDRTVALSDSLTYKQESYAAQAARTAFGMRSIEHLYCSDTLRFTQANLLIDWPFVQFFKQRMVLLSDVYGLSQGNSPPVPVDVLVLSKSPKVSIAECRERFPCKLAVFDASNSIRQVERWKKECEEAGWPYYDVRSMGAWIWRQ